MCSKNVQKIEKIIQKWWNGLNFGVWNGLISGVSSLHVGLPDFSIFQTTCQSGNVFLHSRFGGTPGKWAEKIKQRNIKVQERLDEIKRDIDIIKHGVE